MWIGIFEPREELAPWLAYEKAKEPVKSSPSLGPTFPTYINLHTYAYISHVYMFGVHVTCKRSAPLASFLYVQRESRGQLGSSALGVKMIYVIRLIKRLSAR